VAAGRDYVVPDDVKAVAPPVLAHRLILAPEARSSGLGDLDIVREAVERTPVPV
jgi:MoxR-like ATPase